MTERDQRRFPDWAEQERTGDLAWIHENLPVFWPAAQVGYVMVGRGAIIVDITSRSTEAGPPFGYVDQAAVEQAGDEDTLRMVREYNPAREFVTRLLKSPDRASSYRVRVMLTDPREHLGNRVEPDQPSRPPTEVSFPATADLEIPSLDTLVEWMDEGGCEAACPHQCWIEPDGICEHGHPSWFLKLGLI